MEALGEEEVVEVEMVVDDKLSELGKLIEIRAEVRAKARASY